MKFSKWISAGSSALGGGLSTRLALVAAALLSAACATTSRIDTSHSAVSQDSRVQFIVLHFTTSAFERSLGVLTQGTVSSHYLVRDDPPTVFRLVDESRRAFHAGDSSWQGNTQLNAASIGIEIVNLGYRETSDGGVWFDFPPRQIDAVIDLVRDIARRHGVRPDRIVGHNEVAPQRKVDPGPKFPWRRLADAGLIPWPDAVAVAAKRDEFERRLPEVSWFQERLAQQGFAIAKSGELDAQTRNVLIAFQMRYRPAQFDGMPDAETAALLDVLTGP
jgi:N-acetylmuramoyl-L-alanine amidase